MTFDLDAKSMYTFKRNGYYWINKRLLQDIPSFLQPMSQFYLFLQVHILLKLGFSYMYYLLNNQRSTLSRERGDLWLKHTNLQPNIHDLLKWLPDPPLWLKNNSSIKGAFLFTLWFFSYKNCIKLWEISYVFLIFNQFIWGWMEIKFGYKEWIKKSVWEALR